MGPLAHIAVAGGAAAAVYVVGGGTAGAAAALLTGTLIDADHIVDYVLAEGCRLRIESLRSGAYFRKAGRALVLLHSYELVILASIACAALGRVDIGLGIAFGALTHLGSDVAYYRFTPLAYSTVYRYRHGFRLESFKRRLG